MRFPAVNGNSAYNALIDKHGKIIQPPHLKVVMDVGPYIEVVDDSGNYGIVDQKFRYIIKPNFKQLIAQVTHEHSVEEDAIWSERPSKIIYYFAVRSDDRKQVILNADGKLLFELPIQIDTNSPLGLPVYYDGAFECNRKLGTPASEATFLNLKGEVVPRPYKNCPTPQRFTFLKWLQESCSRR